MFLLPPFHRNIGKRLVKTPKLYFHDAGLAAYLLGVTDAAALEAYAQRGALFECLVVAEAMKRRFNAGETADLHFWRDSAGREVDLLMPHAGRIVPIEIKSGRTFARDWTSAPRQWAELFGAEAAQPQIGYAGEGGFESDGCRVVGWRQLGD